MTLDMDAQQLAARSWFESLRDRICASFESIEAEAGSDARFAFTPWNRDNDADGEGGGGVQGLMKGRIFEKVGVNVSTVGGAFAPEFAKTIHGAGEANPGFFATGISLVAHMANPHVPAVHMNTRFLCTTKRWFGGGADLNPPIVDEQDKADFHARLKAACDAHGADYYDRFSTWADDYFWIPHRKVHRGVGGIFYDHLEFGDDAGFASNFAFTRDVGEAFLDIFPAIVRRRMNMAVTDVDRQTMLTYRGRYAEFNLVYDRGTSFGLKTGGNIDAILMSLPPLAAWNDRIMGLQPIEPHMLATVVTWLEMVARPRPTLMPPSPFRLTRWKQPPPEKYRTLFRRVGEPWLWFSRLVMTDEALTAIIHDPGIEIYAVEDARGVEIGLLELDFRIEGEAEIAFFGFIAELAGKGHGRWLMTQALALGWRRGIGRLWVHTCTLDHPGALGFYRKNGFHAYDRAVETFADPRHAGIMPADAAPHVPMLQADSRR